MKTGTVLGIAAIALVGCCLYTHRRVIKTVINHEEMPKAPAWHVWVNKENRRDV